MNIKLHIEGAKVPTKGSVNAAGYDLYVPIDTTINPGRNIVSMGFSIALPTNTHAHIRPRSGFSAKGFEAHEICDATNNTYTHEAKRYDIDVIQGTIDSDYRGIVGVIVKSNESQPVVVTAGTRIAQMVIMPYINIEFDEVDELNDTERGDGGFGHTGTR